MVAIEFGIQSLDELIVKKSINFIFKFLKFIGFLTFSFSTSVIATELNIIYTHENPKFASLFAHFEKTTGIKANIRWVDQPELKTRLLKITEEAEIPDIIICPADNLGLNEFANFSLIESKLFNENISQKDLATVKVDGNHFGIPIISGNHLVLYFNKNYVQSAPESWQEIVDTTLKDQQNLELITWSFMEMYWFIPFITAFGGEPIVDEQPNLNSQAVQQALKFVWQLAKDNVVEKDCNYDCAFQKFIHGNAIYTINGAWAFQPFKKKLGNNLGMVRLPKINNSRMIPYYSTMVAAFPNEGLTGKNNKALNIFVKYIQSDEFQTQIWSELKDIPTNKNVVNKLLELGDSELELLLTTAEHSIPMSSHKNMTVVWEALLKGYSRYGSGVWNVERSTKFMQSIAERSTSR